MFCWNSSFQKWQTATVASVFSCVEDLCSSNTCSCSLNPFSLSRSFFFISCSLFPTFPPFSLYSIPPSFAPVFNAVSLLLLPSFLCLSCGRQKAFKDTSQYVVGELSALESEQRHIDARAARVEKRLRYLMDTGTPSPITLEKLFWQIECTHTRAHFRAHSESLCVSVRESLKPPPCLLVECCST